MEYIIKAPDKFAIDWKELWRYRELFYFFMWRDITVKYKQAVLGFLWAILQPLFMMIIFTFFFGRALNIPSGGLPYPIFVLSGLLIWNIFSSGLTTAAGSMVNNYAIIQKIYFPRIIIPVSSILVSLFDFFIAAVLFLGLLLIYQQPVFFVALWCWPLSIVLIVVATLGLGCWLAALNVKYRDFRYVIPFLIQVLLFLTPVIYPVSLLKTSLLKYALAASPVYAAVELFRYPLIGEINDLPLIGISVCSSFLFLLAGVFYFRRTEYLFADLS